MPGMSAATSPAGFLIGCANASGPVYAVNIQHRHRPREPKRKSQIIRSLKPCDNDGTETGGMLLYVVSPLAFSSASDK